MKYIKVIAAIIKCEDKILIARRRKGKHLELKWEYPGGKLEKDEKEDKVDELQKYQDMRDRQRKEEIEKSRRDENKVVFTSAPRQDPNRGMRFVNCSDPINKGKLGSSRSFIKKIDRKYY